MKMMELKQIAKECRNWRKRLLEENGNFIAAEIFFLPSWFLIAFRIKISYLREKHFLKI